MCPEQQRGGCRARRENESGPQQLPGIQWGCRTQLVAATGEVPAREGESGDEPAGKSTARQVMPGEQDVHGKDHDGVKQQTDDDLEQN